jgi:tripeptide aminopeptidase
VAVCAHLDTVFPRGTAVRVRQDGELLLGPGIGDNGRGLAAMLALAEEIDGVRLKTDRPIDFVATTGEEGTGDLRGAKAFFRSREDVAAAIALDGAGDERIVHRGLGSRRYRIVYRGPGGHSWAAFGVVNPVHAAGTAIAKLASIIVPREPRTTLSVGRVGGGIAVNAIADEAWLEVDLRSTTVRMLDRYEREVRLAVRSAEIEENARRATGSPPLSCAVELIGDRPCGDVPADHPLVVSAIDATRLIGREPELSTASTDANVPISLGVPAIAIGAGGRGGDAHTPGEWFDNTSGTIGLARALTIVVAAAGLA